MRLDVSSTHAQRTNDETIEAARIADTQLIDCPRPVLENPESV